MVKLSFVWILRFLQNYFKMKSIVEIEIKENGIGFLEINNPPVNALSLRLIDSLSDFLCSLSKKVKVLIISSSGKGFCAGADLKERTKMSRSETLDTIKKYSDLFEILQNVHCPTFARMHGFVLGGGLELSLACDFRFATKETVLGFPEVGIGIIPGAGGTQRLPYLIGLSKSKEWIFTADKFLAEKAYSDGILDKVFSNEKEMDDYIQRMAKKIIKNCKMAVALSKKSLNYSLNDYLDKGLFFEKKMYAKTFDSEIRKQILGKYK